MGQLTRQTLSKFIPNQDNFSIYYQNLLDQIPMKQGFELISLHVNVSQFQGEDVYVSTIICCKKHILKNSQLAISVPKVVLIHGYCGAGSLFLKIFERLADNVCLILIDLMGMGDSDHPKDYDSYNFNHQQSIDYFVNYIELWRKAFLQNSKLTKHPCFQNFKIQQSDIQMKEFSNFYLIGHSFGGYISGNYATQYPQHIKKLILISPIGIRDAININKLNNAEESQKKSQFNQSEYSKKQQNSQFENRYVNKQENEDQISEPNSIKAFFNQTLMKFVWKNKFSPQDCSKFFGQRWTNKMIEESLDFYRNRQDYSQAEIQALHDFFYHLFMREGTSEYALMFLFNHDLHPYVPLDSVDKLGNPDIQFPISFIFGQQDWMLLKILDTGKKLVKLNQLKYGETQSMYWLCPSSSHNIQMDNPIGLSNIILNILKDDLPLEIINQERQYMQQYKTQINLSQNSQIKEDEIFPVLEYQQYLYFYQQK